MGESGFCRGEITVPGTVISNRAAGDEGRSGFPLFNCELMMIAHVRVNFLWKEHKEEKRKKNDLDNKHTIGLDWRKECTMGPMRKKKTKKHPTAYSHC